MKNIQDLLKEKESQLEQIQREIEALRIVARLLDDSQQNASENVKPIAPVAPLVSVPRSQRTIGHAISDLSTRQFP